MELGSVSHALSILQLVLQHVHSRSVILLPILSYYSGWTIEQIGHCTQDELLAGPTAQQCILVQLLILSKCKSGMMAVTFCWSWPIDFSCFKPAYLENRQGVNQMNSKPSKSWECRGITVEHPGLARPAFSLLDLASFYLLPLPEAEGGKGGICFERISLQESLFG